MTEKLLENFKKLLRTRISDLENQEDMLNDLLSRQDKLDRTTEESIDPQEIRVKINGLKDQKAKFMVKLEQTHGEEFEHCSSCGGMISPDRLFEKPLAEICEKCSDDK